MRSWRCLGTPSQASAAAGQRQARLFPLVSQELCLLNVILSRISSRQLAGRKQSHVRKCSEVQSQNLMVFVAFDELNYLFLPEEKTFMFMVHRHWQMDICMWNG